MAVFAVLACSAGPAGGGGLGPERPEASWACAVNKALRPTTDSTYTACHQRYNAHF